VGPTQTVITAPACRKVGPDQAVTPANHTNQVGPDQAVRATTDPAFVQNLRRGHYELSVDIDPRHRLTAIFAELAHAI
jgi:hypothetical protein